jgi:hypothetical protein
MMDSSPRPMPQIVLRAYRKNLQLQKLLLSEAFSLQQRVEVRDELLRQLLKKYGSADVFYGDTEFSTSDIPEVYGKEDFYATGIEALMTVPDYGGEESVSRELAAVMQPYWFRWWGRFSWGNFRDVVDWKGVVQLVLGGGQRLWISAQFARSVIDNAAGPIRADCISAIETSEEYAKSPSGIIRDRMNKIKQKLEPYTGEMNTDSELAIAASWYLLASNANLALAYSAESAVLSGQSYDYLARLAKQLITPTLITLPSRGVR